MEAKKLPSSSSKLQTSVWSTSYTGELCNWNCIWRRCVQ